MSAEKTMGSLYTLFFLYFRKPITTAHACLIDTLLFYLVVEEKFQDKAKQLAKSDLFLYKCTQYLNTPPTQTESFQALKSNLMVNIAVYIGFCVHFAQYIQQKKEVTYT